GVVDFYTGPCGSYGGTCDFGNVAVVVAAIDSQGARTEQSFIVTISPNAVTVPNVQGLTFNGALDALQNATLRPRLLQEQYAAQPAGTVIAQLPEAGGAGIARGTSVDLTVSKGPQPVVVPNVVTRSESSAAGTLSALGFVVQVTHQYSNTIPAGQVITQNPSAGNEVPPGNATIMVSLGSGLIVRLHSGYTTADQALSFEVVSVDQDGVESPFLGATLAITPSAEPYLGALPGVGDASITPGQDTRGAFRITATDGTMGRSASAEFVVAPPVASGDVDPFAQLAETISGVSTLLLEAKQANLAGDDITMTAKARAAVLLWRSFDQTLLRLSAPGTPELGFMPRIADMAGFGVTQTPDDLLNYTSFKTASEKLDALVMGLRKSNTSAIEISALFAEVSTAAEPLASLTPSEYGLIRSRSKHTVIVAHLLPDWMDALMNDLGGTLGMAPAPAAADAPPLETTAAVGSFDISTPNFSRLAGYVNDISDWFIKPAVASTLAEQLTIVAIDEVLDQVNILKKIQDAAMKQAYQVGAMVALASHIKESLYGQELVEVVAGASLSIRLFHSPYSMIEGFNLDSEDPRINNVMVIGPDVVGAVFDIVDLAKKSSQLNFKLWFKSGWDAAKLIYNDNDKIKTLLEQADKPVDGSWRQYTHTAENGCIFSSAPSCVGLIWPSGFASVYDEDASIPSYLRGIPSPIIFLVHSPLDGQLSFATPPFVPYRAAGDQ
ncbi:MAG: PASTA domain-containing protein, partial [Desulfobulbaceae bacterium]|nr:PASTA domain-containing protein [Desulfobulbaceae bacterium]